MIESVQTDNDSADNMPSQNVDVAASDPSPSSTAAPEKMFTQSQVNKLVGATRKKVREEMMQPQNEQVSAQPMQAVQSSSQTPAIDEQKLRQLVAEETDKKIKETAQEQQKEAYKQQVQQFANSFGQKFEAAKVKYPQLDQSFNDLNLINNLPLLGALHSLDDVGGVINELHQNPEAFAKVNDLLRTAPAMAQKKLHQMAASIKANEEAKKAEDAKSVSEPLSQMSPSMANTDSGKRSSADWANYYKGKV